MDASSAACRRAIGVVFLVNGVGVASWAPRIPEIRDGLGIGVGTLGLALLGIGLGGIVGTIVAAPLVRRLGSRAVTLGGALAFGLTLPLPPLAPTWVALGAALTLMASLDGIMDVGMNANAVAAERAAGRPVMSGLHARWSLGAMCAGLAAGPVATVASPAWHLAGVGALLAAVTLLVRRWMAPSEAAPPPTAERARLPLRIPRAIVLLGVLAVLAALAEGAPQDWSAVFLTDVLGSGLATAGVGYAAFAGAMLVGRLSGDALVRRAGHGATLRGAALTTAAGWAVVATSPSMAVAVAGFALAGLGASVIFPLLISVAGASGLMSSGAAVSTVATISRVGFLVGPPAVGGLAEVAGLRVALAVVALPALVVAAVGGIAGRLTAERAEARPS